METSPSSSSSPPKKRKENHYHHHDGGGAPGSTASAASASRNGNSPYPTMPPSFSSPQSLPHAFPYNTGGGGGGPPLPPGYGYPPPHHHFPPSSSGGPPPPSSATGYHHPRNGPPPPHMPQSYGTSSGTPGPPMAPQSVMYCPTVNLGDGSGGYPHPGTAASSGSNFYHNGGGGGGGGGNHPTLYGAGAGATSRSLVSSSSTTTTTAAANANNGMSSSGKMAMRISSNHGIVDGISGTSVRSISSISQKDNSDNALLSAAAAAAHNKDKGRGNYRCGKCGVPKKGHVCPYQPKLKRRSDEPPPEMRNVATQVEMDEFLVVRRLNLEIQGLPESYTAAPMGDVGAEVHPPSSGMVSQPGHLPPQQQVSSSSMVQGLNGQVGGLHPQQSLGGNGHGNANANVPSNSNHRMYSANNAMMQMQESGMNLVGPGPGPGLGSHLGSVNMGEKSSAMGQSLVDGGGKEDGNVREMNGASGSSSHVTEIPSGGNDDLL